MNALTRVAVFMFGIIVAVLSMTAFAQLPGAAEEVSQVDTEVGPIEMEVFGEINLREAPDGPINWLDFEHFDVLHAVPDGTILYVRQVRVINLEEGRRVFYLVESPEITLFDGRHYHEFRGWVADYACHSMHPAGEIIERHINC